MSLTVIFIRIACLLPHVSFVPPINYVMVFAYLLATSSGPCEIVYDELVYSHSHNKVVKTTLRAIWSTYLGGT